MIHFFCRTRTAQISLNLFHTLTSPVNILISVIQMHCDNLLMILGEPKGALADVFLKLYIASSCRGWSEIFHLTPTPRNLNLPLLIMEHEVPCRDSEKLSENGEFDFQTHFYFSHWQSRCSLVMSLVLNCFWSMAWNGMLNCTKVL